MIDSSLKIYFINFYGLFFYIVGGVSFMNNIDGIIIKAIDGFYYILCDEVEYCCRSRKKFRFKEIVPKVGDKVTINIINEDKKEGVIEHIYDRVSDFVRPPIANINQVFIVLSYLEPKINFEMLNKMIINFEAAGVNINVVINKYDLHTEEHNNEIDEIFRYFPYEVIHISVERNKNIDFIKHKLRDNISCFCGPSGVGKSSLINKIMNKDIMETSELSSKVKRGKHTTRFSKLIYLKDLNSYIVDTPGFTSVDILKSIDRYILKNYFIDFDRYSNCKFRECSHINEIDCGVKHALESGKINKMRYEMYVRLYNKFGEKGR